MSRNQREVRSRWGGPARLPLALSGLLAMVAVLLVALVFVGSGIEDPQIAEAPPDTPGESEMAAAEEPEPAAPAPDPEPPMPAANAEPAQSPDPVPDEMKVDPGNATETAAAGPAPEEPVETMPRPEPAAAAEPAVPVAEEALQLAAVPTPPAVATPAPPPPPPAAAPGVPPSADPGLIEQTSIGPLPRIGDDGRLPWQVYARPFDNRDTRPRIAIIMSGLGLSSAATEAAIQGLPGGVTLAFQPFADNLQQSIRLARAAGHEVLLNLPMEPVDFPANDPGPRALFVAYAPEENVERLEWALSRVGGYVGVLNHMGSRFTTSREAMQPVMSTLQLRGLAFVDARVSARSVATVLATEQKVPRAINDRFLDAREVSRTTIDARLTELESIATEVGVSVGIGQAFPVTIERIREWAATLNGKGIVLAPVSAVVDRQADR